MKYLTRQICKMAAGIVLAVVSLSSCSVKEDRWPCPCYLIFKPGEGIDLNEPGGFTAAVYTEAAKELSVDLTWRQIRDDDYTVGVSKGEKYVTTLIGQNKDYISGQSLLIVKGNQQDSIYANALPVSCTGEVAEVPVEKYKQFSTVFLQLEDGGMEFPYFVKVKSNIDGINLMTLEPTLGEFYFEPQPVNGIKSRFEFRLPRQLEKYADELVLEIWVRAANRQEQDRLVDKLPLGKMILDSHHDWTKQSLDDIFIGIDYAQAVTQININDWIIEWHGNFEI